MTKQTMREWMPVAMTAGALAGTALTLAQSLRARGGRRTVLFAALGMGLPVAAEYTAVNVARMIRHHSRPQVRGVPLAAVAWYNIGYASYALIEALLAGSYMSSAARRWVGPMGTALVATSLDLIFDPFGLDLGLWEWRDGGAYAREIVGPNGKAGIPLANFAGWVALTGGIALGYEWLAGASIGSASSARTSAGREAALLLSPYYLAPAGWALLQRGPRYLVASALFPAALVAASLRQPRTHLPS